MLNLAGSGSGENGFGLDGFMGVDENREHRSNGRDPPTREATADRLHRAP